MRRDEFARLSILGSAGTVLVPGLLRSNMQKINTMGRLQSIGIQLFSVPKALETDLLATLGMLSEIGFSEIELYGPYPFSAESNKKGWQELAPLLGFQGSGFFGVTEMAFQGLCRDYGFRVPSMHTDLETLTNHMPALAESARNLGARYVTLPAIPPERRTSLDDYKRMADIFNNIGQDAKKEGIRFAYHNHGYGLQDAQGVIPFELLMDATDPDSVFLEMDIFWTTAGKADPIAYLRKYAGRYTMMHLKDMKKLTFFEGDGGNPQQWTALFPVMTSAGSGVLDLDGILTAALETGVEHFFVEQDMVMNPEVALNDSYQYLHQI